MHENAASTLIKLRQGVYNYLADFIFSGTMCYFYVGVGASDFE